MKNTFFIFSTFIFLIVSFPLFADFEENLSLPSEEDEDACLKGPPLEEISIPYKKTNQKEKEIAENSLSPSLPQAQALFLVNNITYYVNGQTKIWALEQHYKLRERTRFSTIKEMKNYFKSKEKSMLDNKTFSQVKLSYILNLVPTIEIKEPIIVDGLQVIPSTPVYAVHLFVKVQDSITQILFPPIPRIVNDYLVLSLRFTEKNLVGSFIDFQFNGDFSLDISNASHTFIPKWGFSANLGDIFFPGYNQAFSFNTRYNYKTEIENDAKTGEKLLEYDYHDLSFGIGSGLSITPYLKYSFNLINSIRFGNSFYVDKNDRVRTIRKDWGIPEKGIGYSLTWKHILSYSTITDSSVRMRKGYDFWIGNSISYNFNTVNATSTLNWGARFFQPFVNDFIEISFQYIGFWNIDGRTTRGLNHIRGVRANVLSGWIGNYLNTTFLFTFWRWKGVLEAQIGLFLDAGVTQKMHQKGESYKRPIPVSFANFDIGAGVEGRLYLDILRSFVVYTKLGVNLKNLPYTLKQIVFFWGERYDFTIGFSLPY